MNKGWSGWEAWLSWAAVSFLFVIPTPFLLDFFLSLLTDNLRGVIGSGGGYLLFILGAVLLRRGLANDLRRRRRPSAGLGAPPLKLLSAILIGIAVAGVAFLSAMYSPAVALTLGLLAACGFVLVYGLDRDMAVRRRGAQTSEGDFARAMDVAYARLDNISEASRKLPSSELRARCASIVNTSTEILTYIESEPASFRNARKFLNVYLDSAEKLIGQYAATPALAGSADREQNFRGLLVEMDNTCQEQYAKLRQRKALDLDVQIEVLTTRLKHEGIG